MYYFDGAMTYNDQQMAENILGESGQDTLNNSGIACFEV